MGACDDVSVDVDGVGRGRLGEGGRGEGEEQEGGENAGVHEVECIKGSPCKTWKSRAKGFPIIRVRFPWSFDETSFLKASQHDR